MGKLLRQIKSDGELIWQLKCPKCGIWGEIDDDQFRGKVSVLCKNKISDKQCGYHKKIAWIKLV